MRSLFAIYSVVRKRWIRVLFPAIFILAEGDAQTIQYSRQNFKAPSANSIQLVANIGGNHHIVCLTQGSKASLFIYNNALQLLAAKEIPLKLPENADINIIPFKAFYFLYVHQPASGKHDLWKIDSEGNAISLSQSLMNLIDTVFNKNTSTLQLANKNNRLSIIANTYFDQIGKVATAVTLVDENLNIVRSRKVLYSFVKYEEALKQVMLVGDDNVLILKASKDSAGHLLSIIKANLNTGELITNSFNSGFNTFSNPVFYYSAADTSITIYARIARTVFFTRLDSSLNEKVAVTILKTPFKNNVPFHFLLLQDQQQKWLSMTPGNFFLVSRGRSAPPPRPYSSSAPAYSPVFDNNGNIIVNNSTSYVVRNPGSSAYMDNYIDQPSIRFSLLNKNFRVLKDSVVVNDKSSYSIHPREYASINIENKSYLFLDQQFRGDSHGLLMIHGNGTDELTSTDIRVYDKYKYLLPQMQAVNKKEVIVPYTHKRELGLLRITLE